MTESDELGRQKYDEAMARLDAEIAAHEPLRAGDWRGADELDPGFCPQMDGTTGQATSEPVGQPAPLMSDRIRDAWKGETRKGRELRHRVIQDLLEEQDGWRQVAEQMLFRAQWFLNDEADFLIATRSSAPGVADRLRGLAADIRQLLGVKEEARA